jgi:hypothetical protein
MISINPLELGARNPKPISSFPACGLTWNDLWVHGRWRAGLLDQAFKDLLTLT